MRRPDSAERDLSGKTFGRLTVQFETHRIPRADGKSSDRAWVCQCSCGIVLVRTTRSLEAKHHNPNCGCLLADKNRKRNRTHGFAGDGKEPMRAEYNSWKGIKVRCTNEKNPAFKYYGGRGISMCERWFDSFENFYADMGPKPTPKHSIDRINNDGNYEPSNCRWATAKQQMNNRRVSRKNRVSETASQGTATNERANHRT